MRSNRSILFGLIPALLTAGCSIDSNPTGTPKRTSPHIVSSALGAAPGLVAQAVSGKRDRGEQDQMLRVEAKVPGFGGFYIDSLGNVVIYLKPRPTSTQSALARTSVFSEYAARSESNVREIMSKASDARINEGAYSLSELIAVEYRIASNPGGIPGLVGVGTSIYQNHVVVGFRDSVSLMRGLSGMSERGIPASAVVGEIWGEIRPLSNWNSIVRPTRGGIEIGVINRTRYPWTTLPNGKMYSYSGGGSLGFNVRTPAGTDYFMTNAHVINDWSGTNGALGDTVLQPSLETSLNFLYGLGIITVNPAWSEGASCPVRDSTTMARFDYCTTADVALGTYVGGVSGERKIGTSDYEGQNGASGCCNGHIHGWYPIQGVLAPEFVKQQLTLGVHKSGHKTGTTTGTIGVPLAEAITRLCWRVPPYPIPDPCVSNPYLLWQRVTQVLHMGGGTGDSGGAVFSGNGLPYNALGIVVSGGPSVDVNGNCNAGSACFVFFARWDEMQLRLGLTLNPATVQ
jgi:hypothetical protein